MKNTDKIEELRADKFLSKVIAIRNQMRKGNINSSFIIVDFHQGKYEEESTTVKILGIKCIIPLSFLPHFTDLVTKIANRGN